MFFCVARSAFRYFFVHLSYRNTQSLPRKIRGGIFVYYQLFTMKYTQKHYLAPTLHSVALHAERGFGASLEIPVVDPEQGWTARPADEFIEE